MLIKDHVRNSRMTWRGELEAWVDDVKRLGVKFIHVGEITYHSVHYTKPFTIFEEYSHYYY